MSKKIVLIVLILFFLGIGAVLLIFRDAWIGTPWHKKAAFNYPQYAVSSNGDLYVIDTSFRRILRLDKNGQAAFSIDGGRREEGTFFYAQNIVVGKQGELYVHNVVLDSYGMYAEREEILQYRQDGSFRGVVCRRTYSDHVSTLVQRGRMAGFRLNGAFLYWFEVEDDQIVGYRYSTMYGSLNEVGRLDYPGASIYLSDIDWNMDAGFVATTKLGQLIERYWKGESRALYDGEDLTPHVVPWELERAADGTIWFIDLASHAILRRSSDGSIRPVLSRDSLGRAGFPSDNAIFYRLSLGNDGMLVTYTEDSVAVFGGDGRIATVRQGFSYSKQALLIRWAGWAGVVIEICCLVIFAVRFYRDVLNKRISIILKQIIVLVPLLSISIFAVSHMIIRNSTKRLTEEQANRIALMAQNLALMADPSDFKGLNSQRDYMSDKYQGIRARFQRALNGNRDPWNRGFYYAVYRVMNDQIYGLMYYNDRIGMFHPFGWFSSRDSIYRRAAEGEVATEQVSDESGDWLYAVAPVRRPQGGVACLIEVGTDLYIFREANSRLIARTLKLVGGVTLGIILIVVFTTWLVLKALRLLQRGVAQISARNWDVRVRIRSRDEVYDLANTFNDMAQSIHSHLGHIEELNVAYKRFVPQEFLLYLNKPSVIDANLGDQVQKEMTVLFSDIRSFTNLSEKMTPKENFDFLNNYLSAIGPFIRTRNGFIDKYIGDAIMALFARSAEDAVDAAIDMRNALLDFNRNRTALGQEPIEIGIGIHCGTLMLGILGEAERREGTVISDNVNLASRLEHITKQYGAPTILSQAVYERLPNPDRFNFRRLGSVRVKGKTSAMTVYELLDGQPPADRIRKIVAKEPLEAAIRMYERGDFLSARKILDALLETNPDEKVGILYNQACTMHIETGMPQDWDGSITLHIK